jgi:branched-chain amino acid transport system substrate-binding protein
VKSPILPDSPFPTFDFSSFLLHAQASKAEVIGLANGGADTTNAIKRPGKFGITQAGQKIVSMALFISDVVEALGLKAAQGVVLAEPFY